MSFKHGKNAEILLNSIDLSSYLNSITWRAQCAAAKTSTFKSTYHSYIAGEISSQAVTNGYYDPAQSTVRTTLQASPGVLTYAPAGATAIGDQTRLLSFNTVTYNENSKTNEAVGFDWTAEGTAVAGIGVCLHVLASESPGTITGTGDAILRDGSTQTTGGGIGHLHVTAYTSGTQQFKLQDATTQGGAYSDITGGAFTNVTAVGAQRLIIPSGTTIRQYVRCVATIAGAACTYSVSFART